MKIIQELQGSRPDIVRLFDHLVETLPEGVFYTGFTQRGKALSITGIAQSNARVSSLMRNIDSSEWLANPSLGEIKAGSIAKGTGLRMSNFTMKLKQTKPKVKTSDEEESS